MDKQNKPNKNSTPIRQKFPLLIGIGIGALLLVIAGYLFMPGSSETTSSVSQNEGTPSLQVDQEVIDFGEVPFNQMVTASFNLTNTGDGLLKFTELPYIELKEGCWPPKPSIGAMELKPGEITVVSMSFTMHEGMGGTHDFRLHLPTNDPENPDRQVAVLSVWVPW